MIFLLSIIIVVLEMIGFDLWQNVRKSNQGPPFLLHSHYLATYVPVERGDTTSLKKNAKQINR